MLLWQNLFSEKRSLSRETYAVRLRIVPCSVRQACDYVSAFHRHHQAPPSTRYAVAVADENGYIRGVALIGRPVARLLDNGWTLEVNRVATDGCPNACSSLYGAARRLAGVLGYSRLITYIREDEPGTSLRAAGWESEGPIRARSWNMPNRPRTDKTEIVRRERWSARAVGAEPCVLQWPTSDPIASLFDVDMPLHVLGKSSCRTDTGGSGGT